MRVAPFDLEQTDRLLSTTKAVRRRLDFDRPVEPGIIHECLRLAVQAPTGGNAQTWRWMIVTEQTLKDQIAEIYREESLGYLNDSLREATYTSNRQQERVFGSALYLAENLQRVPVMVIPCVDPPIDLSSNAKAAGSYGSIIPAAWSLALALRCRGLGSTPTTLHLYRESSVADLLGIPASISQISLLPVAYTKGLDFKPARRPPVEDITFWNQWGKTL